MDERADKRRMCKTQGKFNSVGMEIKQKNVSKSELHTPNTSKHEVNEDSPHGKGRSTDKYPNTKTNQHRIKQQSGTYDSKNRTTQHQSGVVYDGSSYNDGYSSQLKKSHHIETISNSGKTHLSHSEYGDSIIFYKPDFIKANEGNEFLAKLSNDIKWLDKKVIIDGQERPQPRLVAWFGPLPYTYSGVTLQPKEFPPLILQIKKYVEEVLRKENISAELNSVLLNLYRDGKDSVAWHSDDESSMGIKPTIASVSLGEIRRFELRRKPMGMRSTAPADYVVHLEHGSLVVMDGAMQLDWQHRVPKEYHDKGKRINLTFRTVYPIEKVSRSLQLFCQDPIAPPHPKMNTVPFEFQTDSFPALGDPGYNRQSFSSQQLLPQLSLQNEKNHGSYIKTNPVRNNKGLVMDSLSSKIDNSFTNFSDVCKTDANTCIPETSGENQGIDLDNINITGIPMDQDDYLNQPGKNVSVKEFIPRNLNSLKSGNYSEVSENMGNITQAENSHHMQQPFHQPRNYRNECGEMEDPCHEEKGNPNEINRLNDLYDYFVYNWNELPFKWRDKEELAFLLSVVEHSESCSTDVISMVSDRMEYLNNRAEGYQKRQHGEGYQGKKKHYQNSGNGGRNKKF